MRAGLVSWDLERGDYAGAAVARQAFVAHLRVRAVWNADYDAAEVIFGELVANAVTHARTKAIAEVWFDEWAHLHVRDDGGACTQKPIAAAPQHVESGRGLYMVRALARALRIESTDDGWLVTVELPVRAKSAVALGSGSRVPVRRHG